MTKGEAQSRLYVAEHEVSEIYQRFNIDKDVTNAAYKVIEALGELEALLNES